MSNYANLSLCSCVYVFISSTDIIITKRVSTVLLNDWYENLHDVIIEYLKVSVNDYAVIEAKAEAETTAVKPTSTPAKPSMTKLTFFKLRDGFLQIQKLKVLTFFVKLTKQVQSVRGTLSSKSREAIFSIFRSRLPPINTNARLSEVAKWKKKPKVKDCFEGLFKKMNPKDKNSSIVLASIIDRALQNDHSNAELAYVLAIYSTILNPNHDEIMCKKNIMKQKVKKFLKKINSQTGINYSDFEDNSYEEEESGNETEDEDDDV
ncbi:unnamed protein product [Rhizophagus irregularis]|nr:unnamed protein product [Rhizophagus irregularis]